MIECPDYGDPVLVPRSWYETISAAQRILWAREFQECYGGIEEPVVLRGSLHCRMAKWRTQSAYGRTVIDRYIRMKRITEVDQRRWVDWCYSTLFKMCYRKPWWHNQMSLRAVCGMVCDYSVVIEGEFVTIYDKDQMANVKKIYAAMKRIGTA